MNVLYRRHDGTKFVIEVDGLWYELIWNWHAGWLALDCHWSIDQETRNKTLDKIVKSGILV